MFGAVDGWRHYLLVELQAVKVADANGNPLVISGVVNYRVVDPTRAALDVLHLGGVLRFSDRHMHALSFHHGRRARRAWD